MGLNSYNSDYGSGGSSMNSSSSWGSQELDWQTFQANLLNPRPPPRTKAASYADLVNGRCTIEDVMQEFRMNGSDAPYNPDDEHWANAVASELPSGSPAYLRQRSWPAPERSPAPRLPRPVSVSLPLPPAPPTPQQNNEAELCYPASLTDEQRRVLNTLPDAAVLSLLREMQRLNKQMPDECRFCKNNGERESYYRSHSLKDCSGRVECPVLRAFVCRRCGARGDTAHTIKYCPLSTSEERMVSAAMMRSVRMASGRRRAPAAAAGHAAFGAAPHTLLQDGVSGARRHEPLDPLWAELERKLML